ncbi:TOBE domain-containing protein [Diaphorobacter aerolatus]|uniref:TOBE domain-containing protein n=1 Tax=Diaphorobacter aerolatus TaxID=1288495 RepID=UPI00299F7E75|nr:TOBE domain-containing protein [Diaphorobacter aerolatus]
MLTEAGRQLLSAAHALQSARASAVQNMQPHTDLPAGTAARLAIRTSMRNQWPCVVTGIEVQGHLVRVHLRAEASEAFRVRSRITLESAELLGLRTGIRVQALCKATAVRAVRDSKDTAVDADGFNAWNGSVTRISRGSLGDEITAALGATLQIVGFSAPGEGLRVRSRVVLKVDESAIVLALD